MMIDLSYISDSFGYWFSGFVDGEGCFCIIKHYKGKNIQYQGVFALGLRSDDKDIILKIKKILNIGNIHFRKADRNLLKNTNSQCWFRTAAVKDCKLLVKLFEKYPLQTKKKNDFEIWKLFISEKLKPFKEQDNVFLKYCYLKIKEVRLFKSHDNPLQKPMKINRQFDLRI